MMHRADPERRRLLLWLCLTVWGLGGAVLAITVGWAFEHRIGWGRALRLPWGYMGLILMVVAGWVGRRARGAAPPDAVRRAIGQGLIGVALGGLVLGLRATGWLAPSLLPTVTTAGTFCVSIGAFLAVAGVSSDDLMVSFSA